MTNYHTKILVAIGIVLLAGGSLLVGAAKKTTIYYLHADELMKDPDRYSNRHLRLNGFVVKGSLARPEPLEYRFALATAEGTYSVDVSYSGAVPDAFKEGAEVVVEGYYPGEGRMTANTILTKCPSKYEPAEAEPGEKNKERKESEL